jgi:squalene cyclase
MILLTKISLEIRSNYVALLIDSYPECTSSVLQALVLFKELYSGYRTKEIETSVRNAATFIESKQQEDGSWFALIII